MNCISVDAVTSLQKEESSWREGHFLHVPLRIFYVCGYAIFFFFFLYLFVHCLYGCNNNSTLCSFSTACYLILPLFSSPPHCMLGTRLSFTFVAVLLGAIHSDAQETGR
ncbi:hypothetical protein, unlikely [Trypanosoma brucei gambiense DAL972]|uniref:Uncharacterized protein n=1 Tax=Trypanosoma brucei gambiense (strain MHOM/CI/86/DAL972) TaxID=679716 RepID=D0A4E8_TRYB9|nr:hypothetical protein, unlikely [Trypanosoma brucei gambiense DAL972]CBH16142.1 hypothetical protein, unlikely [Trypanosoma brucei gambiense DAL972]|eukprot:XP_011778406.1 hypothetical protein, unlikely [Trypanosoma brucei gambiense DAL972]